MIKVCEIRIIISLISLLCLTNISFCQENLGKITTICIDAGHGGKDPGAVGTKNQEKNIVLKVALRVGQLIKEKHPDIKVVYTRDKDVFIPLSKRGEIANKNKADLFISIHTNSFEQKSVNGVETYVLGLHKSQDNLRVAMKENAAIKYEEDYSIKYDGFDPNRAESYIIFSMLKNLHLGKSLDMAGLVHEELVSNTQKKDRGVRQAGYLVLKDVAMPAILIEVGYISNLQEERYMASKEGQEKISQAIAKGFFSYKEKFEKNSHVLNLHEQTEINNEKNEIKNNKPALNTELFYAIQIASSTEKIKNSRTFKVQGEVEEIYNKGRYKYYTVKSRSYDEVIKNLDKIKKTIPDCFIIAIYNQEVISVAEARKLENN
ncbi:MAG: N-acetylmuramoyl-L-alanine amidase [Odoribacter sp.]|nr:N-acetylmuramoyl-L-alanine amidase [Odoribacter sp.]